MADHAVTKILFGFTPASSDWVPAFFPPTQTPFASENKTLELPFLQRDPHPRGVEPTAARAAGGKWSHACLRGKRCRYRIAQPQQEFCGRRMRSASGFGCANKPSQRRKK